MHKTIMRNVLVIVLILHFLACIDIHDPTSLEKKIFEEPIQQSYTGNPIYKRIGTHEFTLVPVATYKISALVICKKYYNADEVDELAPFDLCITWGDMAKPPYMYYFSCTQRDRGCNITAQDSPLDDWYVTTHFSNIHIIPADDSILELMRNISVNQIVYLEGFLVNVYSNNTTIWETSLTPEDSGETSCEVLYVTGLKAYHNTLNNQRRISKDIISIIK